MKKVILFAAAALLMAGCCACLKGTKRSAVPITGEPWKLIQMDGRAFEAAEGAYTIALDDQNRFTGKGACNRLTGTYAADNTRGTFSMEGAVATRMMCLDQKNEDRFVALLTSADAYTIDGLHLMLFTNGEMTLMLERVVAQEEA